MNGYLFCTRCCVEVTDDAEHDLANPKGFCPVTRMVNAYLAGALADS